MLDVFALACGRKRVECTSVARESHAHRISLLVLQMCMCMCMQVLVELVFMSLAASG